jgi:RNase adapter protein RapZ
MSETKLPQVVLITGLSGSGKSIAAATLEDIGFYCVDNLPISLLRLFLADPTGHAVGQENIAVVTDSRAPGFAETLPDLVRELKRAPYRSVVIYLEASESSIVRRYSETRRAHPMAEGERPVIDGLRREREMLAPLRDAADLVLDTSDWSLHDLRKAIVNEFRDAQGGDASLIVSLVSFGFKHGPPAGSDLLFDVRFLANPHFIPELREQTGRDAPVRQFLENQPDYHATLDHFANLLFFLLPRFVQENRRYLTIAIGCTGGHHRSVALVEALAARIGEQGFKVRLSHRDVER